MKGQTNTKMGQRTDNSIAQFLKGCGVREATGWGSKNFCFHLRLPLGTDLPGHKVKKLAGWRPEDHAR